MRSPMPPAEAGVGPWHTAHEAAAQPGGLGQTPGAPHPSGSEPYCVRCGYPVPERPLGCRWPCPNCGFLYPRGDCSD